MELRAALDALAVELCATRLTDDELSHLRASTETVGRTQNAEQAIQHSFDFQRQLTPFSGNALIPLIFSSF